MARQGIGTGSAPNDGTGDTLRAGAAKANDNFSELYNYLGDGNNLTAVIGSGIATAGGTVGTGATILDFRGTGISTVTVSSGIATINITGGGGSSYSDSDVDTHLNTSSASASEVLSWTGTDYDWVAQSGGSGITTADVRTNTLVVSGVSTFQADVRLLDDDQLSFGADNDTKITHDENNTVVNHTGTGRFIVRAGIGSTVAVEKDGLNPIANFTPGGSVDLYYNGTKRFETTGAGVTTVSYTHLTLPTTERV